MPLSVVRSHDGLFPYSLKCEHQLPTRLIARPRFGGSTRIREYVAGYKSALHDVCSCRQCAGKPAERPIAWTARGGD